MDRKYLPIAIPVDSYQPDCTVDDAYTDDSAWKDPERMNNDWVLILSDVTKSSVVIKMVCRETGKA